MKAPAQLLAGRAQAGKNVVIIGAAFREGGSPKSYRNNKGDIRGFDVRTGKRLWTFHTIPRKGEFGYDTWLNGSADNAGNTGVWTQITADEELGLVYLPIESPTGDYYGGHRPGDNLYGESLVCVDLLTGVRKWHYQLVRQRGGQGGPGMVQTLVRQQRLQQRQGQALRALLCWRPAVHQSGRKCQIHGRLRPRPIET